MIVGPSESAWRTLLRFALLSAVNHQVTYTCVEGSIFEAPRSFLRARGGKLGELAGCHLCMGTWVGFLQAAMLRPRLIRVPGPVWWPGPAARSRA